MKNEIKLILKLIWIQLKFVYIYCI